MRSDAGIEIIRLNVFLPGSCCRVSFYLFPFFKWNVILVKTWVLKLIYLIWYRNSSFCVDGNSEEQEQQELLMEQPPKRFFSSNDKGLNDFYRSSRLSEFLGGPGKRYSSYLTRSQGSPGYLLAKKLSEFLGGPGKKRPRASNEGYFSWVYPSKSGFPEGSEFLGGPGKRR